MTLYRFRALMLYDAILRKELTDNFSGSSLVFCRKNLYEARPKPEVSSKRADIPPAHET